MQLLPHSFDWMVLMYGILSAFLSLFINYIIQPGEIFGAYTVFFAKRKLKQLNSFDQYKGWLTVDGYKVMLEAAQPYFTWEKMIGMCIVCTGFWISLVCGFFYTLDPVKLIEIVLISHVSVRGLTKFL